MNDNIFPNVEQEAQRAANELQEIKIQMKEFLIKMTQIEKRLKVLAPNIQTKKAIQTQEIKQIYSDIQLKEKYELYVNQFKQTPQNVLSQLEKLDKHELFALAKFLGCAVSKNPSEKKLVEAIVGRLKESTLLRG